ncbi:MAG: NAD(P)-dependent oxidoreductase [Lachnospiraceae bacterium]|nr:NAD(P)-dependent oxidoreductase [Lachnospiraceae bacterium]
MEKKVLVLGATGNLGAYSAVALERAGFDVIATGKRRSDNGFFSKMGIPYYSVDITDAKAFDVFLDKNIDTVVNFAGELPSRCVFNPQALISTITEATVNVLEFMRKSGAKKIIFPTTPYDLFHLHETGIPIDPDTQRGFPAIGDHSIYAIAKNAAVDLIEHFHFEYGISRFILRFFTIYQYHPNAYHYADGKMRMMPYRSLIRRAQQGETISIYGNPERVKEMVYIKDFTKVVVAATKSELEGGFYNIGSPHRVSLDEMIHGIVEIFSPSGNKSEILYDPTKPDTLQSMLDWSKTKRDLGYEPEYSYIEMLKDFKNEMEKEPLKELWGSGKYYDELYGANE